MPDTIHLIDASPYIFRAFFSIPDKIRDPQERPVNAVYGFSHFLRKLIADEEPTHLGLAYDESLDTSFRNDFFPEYKAQREKPPEDLKRQLTACLEMGAALGAATYVDSRYEADDLIGTLCHQLVSDGHEVVIVTSDKDLAQLVGPSVTLWDFAKDTRYGSAEVVEKFGVEPGQIIDLLALMGDSVDNIPGVAGVGKKTAVALLAALGDLDTVYSDLDAVATLPIRGAKSLARKLEEQREMAELSKRLATIALDAPATADLEALRYDGPRLDLLDPLVERVGFDPLRR